MPQPPNISDQDLPLGPTNSAWDQAKAWIEDPIGFWTKCHADYGETFTLQFGSQGTTVVFCKPADVREVFALTDDAFVCGPFNEHYRVIMGQQSLLVSDGDDHREKRRYLSPSFHASNSFGWISTIREQVRAQLGEYSIGDEIPIRKMIHQLSFDVILHVLFRDQQLELRKLLRKLFSDHIIKDYGTWSPWARFVKWQPALRKLLSREITKHRQLADCDDNNAEAPGLFHRLVEIGDDQAGALSDHQIEDHVFTMLVAGVDPSAIATTWAVHWILQDKLVWDQLNREIEQHTNLDELVNTPSSYLHTTCLESLRMYPVVTVPSGRKLLKPVEIGGRSYGPGVTLVPCTYLVHRDPEIFPDPDHFNPDRFESTSFQSYEYFPFGGGIRRCIGAQLAMATMKTILAETIRICDLMAVTDGPVVPVRHGTLLAPSDNFRVRLNAIADI